MMDFKKMADILVWYHYEKKECSRDTCTSLSVAVGAALEIAYKQGFDDGVEDCNPCPSTAHQETKDAEKQ